MKPSPLNTPNAEILNQDLNNLQVKAHILFNDLNNKNAEYQNHIDDLDTKVFKSISQVMAGIRERVH